MAFNRLKRSSAPAFSPNASLTDEALIERIAQRDEAALRVLIERHQARISRYVFRFVGDSSLVEDVIAETFFAVWRQARHFERRSSVATWLSAIARYKALSLGERKAFPIEPLNDMHAASLADSRPRPDDVIEGKQLVRQLQRSLVDLPPEQATLFDLVYFRDKSLQETSSITGVPKNTIKSRMFRARKKLAVALGVTMEESASLLNS
jgi:RNA polymerase sigma-70 factor (ECF subfamily)